MAKRKAKNKQIPLITVIAAVVVFLASFIAEQAGVWDDTLNEVANNSFSSVDTDGTILDAYFIDVGQGDCSLFISDGKTMLIDCGESENAETVIQTISGMGIEKLDYAVVSHAHSDHMGAMADVITEIGAENLLLSEPCNNNAETATYEEFIDAADASGANIILAQPDYTFTLGYAECTVLSPAKVSSNENDNSVVLHISAGKTSFLLTGDAEKKIEKEIMENYPNLTATILKAGHHGSSTSSHEDFIEQLSPETAIIQCGLNNSYGHPHEETVSTLKKFNITSYRNDICGNIMVSCSTDGYKITTEK